VINAFFMLYLQCRAYAGLDFFYIGWHLQANLGHFSAA
jgi:hypothetical protein